MGIAIDPSGPDRIDDGHGFAASRLEHLLEGLGVEEVRVHVGVLVAGDQRPLLFLAEEPARPIVLRGRERAVEAADQIERVRAASM